MLPRIGTPRRRHRPTNGARAALLARAMRRPLTPAQRHIVDVGLELDPATGLYAYPLVVVTLPRQSGKSTVAGVVAEDRVASGPHRRAWLTQQTGKDASGFMRDEHIPAMARVPMWQGRLRFRRSQGSETVTWTDLDSWFRVFPPQRDALHGKQSDLVLVDEAWAHDKLRGDELRQAIIPTQETRRELGHGQPQVWVLSTAGDGASEYLREYVAVGRQAVEDGRDAGVAYLEWSIPDEVDPDDVETVASYHPGVGYTSSLASITSAREQFGDDVDGFARAYGNRPTSTAVTVIPPELWFAAGDTMPNQPDRVAVGYDVALDRSRATIGVAWRDGDLRRVEVVDSRPGTSWVVDRLLELARSRRSPVCYDAAGPALDVADDLARAKHRPRLVPLSTADYAGACSLFYGRVVDGRLRHARQPVLDSAVDAAGRRNLGDGRWAWGRRLSAGQIDPLVAVTVALHHAEAMRPTTRTRIVVTPV